MKKKSYRYTITLSLHMLEDYLPLQEVVSNIAQDLTAYADKLEDSGLCCHEAVTHAAFEEITEEDPS